MRYVFKNIIFFSFLFIFLPIRNIMNSLGRNSYASIIMYHRVNNIDINTMSVNVEMFSRQIEFLKKKYHVITLSQLLNDILEDKRIHPKSVAITFDDGYKDNYTNAFPILKQYGLPATFFITTSYIDTQKKFPWDEDNKVSFENMSWDDLKYLLDQGCEIGSHTVNHTDLGICTYEEAYLEINASKRELEKQLGIKIDHFSLPFGKKQNIKPEFRQLIVETGYRSCLMGYGGLNYASTDVFELKRISIPRTDSFLCFKAYLEGFKKDR